MIKKVRNLLTITRIGNIVNSLLSECYDASVLYGYSCLSIVTLRRHKLHIIIKTSKVISVFRGFLRGNTNLLDEQLI
nr:hypothetical protein TDPV-241 [Oriental turtle dovepox virus]